MTDTNTDQVAITIIHGDIENEAEMKGLEAVRRACDPYWIKTHGTNDTTTYYLHRAGVTALMRAVRMHRRSWWKVTMTGEAQLPT